MGSRDPAMVRLSSFGSMYARWFGPIDPILLAEVYGGDTRIRGYILGVSRSARLHRRIVVGQNRGLRTVMESWMTNLLWPVTASKAHNSSS